MRYTQYTYHLHTLCTLYMHSEIYIHSVASLLSTSTYPASGRTLFFLQKSLNSSWHSFKQVAANIPLRFQSMLIPVDFFCCIHAENFLFHLIPNMYIEMVAVQAIGVSRNQRVCMLYDMAHYPVGGIHLKKGRLWPKRDSHCQQKRLDMLLWH